MPDRERSAETSAGELFAAALDVSPQGREAFLNQECKSPELRRVVEGMLKEHESAGSFLERPLLTPLLTFDESGDLPETGVGLGQSFGPGKRLGRYTIVEPLGSGGMGVVYRALDEKLERTVAIKILAPGMFTGEDARRRFRKEALALAKLNHEHIAAVYDVGEQQGIDYIVMECVAGGSLAARIRSGPLTLEEATSIALQVARALVDAHERGVVHCDLKPANIMLTPKGQAKVLDFGLAKLLTADPEATRTEMHILAGTPLYMSPEQAQGRDIDLQTDLWSLGVVYYEALTGHAPFRAEGNIALLRAIVDEKPLSLRKWRPDLPALAESITERALQKKAQERYQTATEMAADLAGLLGVLQMPADNSPGARWSRYTLIVAGLFVAAMVAICGYFFYRQARRTWASEVALPRIRLEIEQDRPLAAFLLLQQVERFLPGDARVKQTASELTQTTVITSQPAGATVEIQDYANPEGPWYRLGITPMAGIRMPRGYFRWRLNKSGLIPWLSASLSESKMTFPMEVAERVPGMVSVPGGTWADSVDFVGWLGPYTLPPFLMDRFEVTNRDYQSFVDQGGYRERKYWPERFVRESRELGWDETMTGFRDTTGRSGPSTWLGGHYPEGRADYPVTGVSWFEASAYAAFAGKSLPVLAEWYQAAPPDVAQHTIPQSNLSTKGLAPVGKYKGLGPFGTYDMAGNVSEWVANPVDHDLRLLLGGSWKSPSYLYFDPEALSPFDRSETNGFRCVRNLGAVPADAAAEIHHVTRDFLKFKPASDTVFEAYKALYHYPDHPLNARVEEVVQETADWREEKITFDTAYRGERMSAYLFLPKKVKPPYQAVLFFPSARVEFLTSNQNGRDLGDVKFFDYVVQSGRAVMYPIYQDTYERRVKYSFPGGAQDIELTTEWYKDAARAIDYLQTRSDVDRTKLAYLGVSMGSAEGIIATTLLQDRLKAVVFLDGGYFLDTPPPGGDQADFAPRMKKPVLMVNGRYDFTFSLDKSQNPLFEQLGTSAGDKRHVVLETPHDVTDQRPQLVKAVLDWLDRYLGKVN